MSVREIVNEESVSNLYSRWLNYKRQNRVKTICPQKETLILLLILSFILLTIFRKEWVKKTACSFSWEQESVHTWSIWFHHYSQALTLKECCMVCCPHHFIFSKHVYMSWRIHDFQLLLLEVMSYLPTWLHLRGLRLRHNPYSQKFWHYAKCFQVWNDQLLEQPLSWTLDQLY